MPLLQQPVAVTLETILFATDFTAQSRRAAEYAKGLARRFNSTLELVNVFNPTVISSWEAAGLEIPPEEKARIVRECLNSFERELELNGIKTRSICESGRYPADVLKRLAKAGHADLIIAGTQSKTGLERLVLGSTAEQLIRSAPCPVLTVGPKALIPGSGPLVFKSILYANDFSPEATKAAVYALSFAEDSGASLCCCYAMDEHHRPGEDRTVLEATFQKALEERIPESSHDWCSPKFVVKHGDAALEILSLAERVGADLVVLGARKSSFWLNRVERGLTPALLAEATCPVLTVC